MKKEKLLEYGKLIRINIKVIKLNVVLCIQENLHSLKKIDRNFMILLIITTKNNKSNYSNHNLTLSFHNNFTIFSNYLFFNYLKLNQLFQLMTISPFLINNLHLLNINIKNIIFVDKMIK